MEAAVIKKVLNQHPREGKPAFCTCTRCIFYTPCNSNTQAAAVFQPQLGRQHQYPDFDFTSLTHCSLVSWPATLQTVLLNESSRTCSSVFPGVLQNQQKSRFFFVTTPTPMKIRLWYWLRIGYSGTKVHYVQSSAGVSVMPGSDRWIKNDLSAKATIVFPCRNQTKGFTNYLGCHCNNVKTLLVSQYWSR